MVSHYLVLILVALLGMQHHGFLGDGWEWVQCFLFLVATLKLEPLITSHGPLGKRCVLIIQCYGATVVNDGLKFTCFLCGELWKYIPDYMF